MGYSSLDQIVSASTVDGQIRRVDWNKNFLPTSAAAASEWHCLARGGGNPAADTLYNTGTNLAFQAASETTTGAGGLQLGMGNVSPATKHILNASAFTSAATTCPCTMMLVDLLGFYRVTSVTSTSAQTLDNTVTLPRYTTGAGVQAMIWNTNSTAMGAATPAFTLVYTNQAGTGSRTTPATLPVGKTAGANGLILYSGTGSGKYGPAMPLQGSDSGIRSIQSIQLSASYVSGEFSIGLFRPLITMPLVVQGVATERDFVNALPSFPQVFDGANLHWLVLSTVATPINSSYFGHLDIGWN